MATQDQNVEYRVVMVRPDRSKVKVRKLYGQKEAPVRSLRQLAGFLNHLLFSDAERGGTGTVYHFTVKTPFAVRHFTIRVENGEYRLI